MAGLGDKFFYSNATETINSSLKNQVEKSKSVLSPGKVSKCSYGEFVKIAKRIISRYQRNLHRAVLGGGRHRLAPNYQQVAVTEDA